MSDALTVRGVEPLQRSLHAAGDDLAGLDAAQAQVAGAWAARARTTAPRVSGRLAASVTASSGPGVATVSSALPYAGPIHGGWHARNIAPNPFITRAAELAQAQLTGIYAEHIDHTMGKVHGA